jgi:hypothetical protein
MSDRFTQMEKVRRIIDKVAYYSLILDIMIASITTMSLMHIGNPEAIMVPVNYALTAVVVLSIGLFVLLFYLKHEEKILDNLTGRKYIFKKNTSSIWYKLKMKVLYDRNKKLSR